MPFSIIKGGKKILKNASGANAVLSYYSSHCCVACHDLVFKSNYKYSQQDGHPKEAQPLCRACLIRLKIIYSSD